MKNLWEADRRIVFKEIYQEYLREGYSQREAKRLAKEEAASLIADDRFFVKNVMDMAEEDE
jgi:hypothetical protein